MFMIALNSMYVKSHYGWDSAFVGWKWWRQVEALSVCAMCVYFSHTTQSFNWNQVFWRDRENWVCPYDLRKLNKKDSLVCHARILWCAREHIYTSVNLKFKSEISSENVLHNLISSLKSNRRYAGIKCEMWVSECECIFNYSVSALAFE